MGKSFRQIPTPQEILGDEPKRKIPTPQEILGEDHPLVKKKETSGGGVINSSTGGQTVQGIQSWEATPEFEKRYNEAQPREYEQINKAPQSNTTAVAKPKVTKDVLADLDTKRRNNETGYAKEAIAKGKTIAEMAAMFRAGQDPDFKAQYDALSNTGLRQDVPVSDLLQGKMGEEVRSDPSLIFGEATQGDNIRNAFSNPQFIAELKKNPEVYSQFKNEMSNFLTHYPEAGKTYLGNILSQKMENMGINNGLMNVVSKSELDKVVNKLKEEGELTPAEIDFVNRQIRPRMGLENLGRTIVGKPSIKTTGLVENALESAVKSGRDLGQGIAEITGLRPLIQGEAGALSSDIEREKRQVQVKGANLWHDITQYGGQTLGQTAITGGVGRGLQALKLVKGAPAALALSGGMQAYGNYAPEARKMFPTNVAAQRGFSTIMAGIEAGTENIFRDDKVVKGLLGEMRGTVKKTINDFTQKNITAAAAKETIGDAFKQALHKVPEAAKYFAKAVGENTLEEVAAQIGQDITEGVFEGKPIEDLVNIDNIGNTARQAFLGSAFIGGLAARADMKKNRGISAKQIYLMARDPETWADQIRKTNNSPEDASDLQDKLGNLEFASNLLKELDANTIMSEKQKTKFLLTALDSKIKTEQQPNNQITDPSIRAQADAKIREAVAENDKIKEDILSGKDDGTFEGDKTDEANSIETKLFEQIYEKARPVTKATLDAAKKEGNILGGVEYIKDKFAENPIKFREDYGDEISDKVMKITPTETFLEKMDYLYSLNPQDPSISVIDQILADREPKETFEDETEQNKETIAEGTEANSEVNEPATSEETQQPTEAIATEGQSTGEGQPPISEPPKGSRIHVERPATELSHRGLQDVANEFSLDDVKKRDRKTDIQLRKDAENTINSWIEKGEYGKKVEGLVKEAETTGKLSDEERVILEQHLANLSGELRSLPKGSSEFDTKLAEIKRLKEAGERARSEAGAALRIPTFRSRPKDLADYYVAEMEAAGVDKLTDQQKATVEKEFNDISEAEKKWQEKVAALEEENAKLRAEQEIKSVSGKTKKGQKKDFKAERKQIVDDIREKLKKVRGESQATVVPYLKELIAISPDVAKLMRSYVEQGITELADLVKQIHSDIKDAIPDVTEGDVIDMMAGKYNEKITRSDLAAKLRDLRQQAKVMSDLERLEKINPKNNQAEIDLNRRKKELKDKLGGRLNKNDKTKVRDEIAEIEERLKRKDYDYESPLVKKPELDKDAKAIRDKLLKLREERTIRLMKLDYQKRPKIEKVFRFLGQIASIPRVLKSSFDVSMPFRQGIWGLSRQLLALPIGGNKDFHVQKSIIDQFKKMYQAVGHKDNYLRAMADIKDNPRYEVAEKAGLNLSDPNSELQEAREEMYGPNIISKYIPFFGKPVTVKNGVDGKEAKIGGLTEISERSASMFVNQMKWDVFNEIVDLMESNGKTIENSLEDYKQAANYANKVVGRGVLGKKVENLGYVTSRLFFSLRLMASRLQLLTDVVNPYFYHKAPKEVREAYWKDYIKFVSLAGTALLLAKAAGGDVEDDPTSSDAGKVRVGKSRYDILGGFGQYGVFGARMITGKTTSATTGETKDLGSERGQKSRAELLLSFLRSKSSPEAGFAWNVLQGKNVIGQPTTLGKETKELFTPLMYQDIQNAFKDQSVAGAILTTLLIAHGVGYGSYDFPEKQGVPERPERPENIVERPEQPERPSR